MQTMLAIVGFVGLIAMVILLLKEKTSVQVTFILISGVVGFGLVGLESLSHFGLHLEIGKALGIKGDYFGLKELSSFVKKGVMSVAETAALFLFSILFFTVLNTSGMFDKIINALIKQCGKNTYSVTILTVVVAVIAHLDGTGASTFLIAIPALMPIYHKMGMRPTTMMMLTVSAMGVMNLLPWGGPTLRVAIITNQDVTELWTRLMPIQGVWLVFCLILAVYMGFVESQRLKKLGITLNNSKQSLDSHKEITQETFMLRRDNNFVVNCFLLIFVLVLLVFAGFPSYFPFMIGSTLALLINYPNLKNQDKVVKKASSSAIMMATTLLAAGVLIGVFDKSGIMKVMAGLILNIMPESLGTYLPIIIGILAVPMAVIFCTDSYFYGILPIVASVGAAFGIDAVTLGIVMVVCRNSATFMSPVVPATLLGCGLANISVKEHVQATFFYAWIISIACLISGYLLGVIHL